MHPVALGLVLLSAGAHVYWNAQVKRSPVPGLATWWVQAIGVALLAPAALPTLLAGKVPPAGWRCVAASGLLYAAYFLLIARCYRHDDLSRAYPIARGVAPAVTVLTGTLLLGERPSFLGWAGIVAISLGVVWLTLPPGRERIARAGGVAAIATGGCTAAYSAVDKVGVACVEPVAYLVLTYAASSAIQLPLMLRGGGRDALLAEVRRDGRGLALAAIACLGGYLLVLLALRVAPVSYVVPLRSVSVLLSLVVGSRILGEVEAKARLPATVLIMAGMAAIATGG